MLYAFLEISLSLLAALGLCALVWLCRGWLLEPEASAARFYAVIPAGGDGGGALAEALAAREAGVVLLGPEELTRYCV